MGLSVALGYIKPIAVTCIALWLCLTLACSVTICHQCRHSHTHIPGALGNEKGGVRRRTVCDCTRVYTSAGSLREEACMYYWAGELYVKEVCF